MVGRVVRACLRLLLLAIPNRVTVCIAVFRAEPQIARGCKDPPPAGKKAAPSFSTARDLKLKLLPPLVADWLARTTDTLHAFLSGPGFMVACLVRAGGWGANGVSLVLRLFSTAMLLRPVISECAVGFPLLSKYSVYLPAVSGSKGTV